MKNDFVSRLKALSEATRILKKQGKDIKQLIADHGVEALEVPRKIPKIINKFSSEKEDAILDYSLEHPSQGQRRVALELNKKHNWKISEGGVRRVWVRHNLELVSLRMQRLKAYAAEGRALSDAQKAELTPKVIPVKPQIRDLLAEYPGALLAQSTFSMGIIPGIGKIYQQTLIDVFSGRIFAKAYTSKTAFIAAEFLDDQVIPFYSKYRTKIEALQTNPELIYCGKESHPFELFLLINDIEHKVGKLTAPQLLRSKTTFLKEFYSTLSKRNYSNINELNRDLEDYLEHYNNLRKSTDRWAGQYPQSIFEDGVRQFIKPKNGESYEPQKWEPKNQSLTQ
jgi:hypothetical protein